MDGLDEDAFDRAVRKLAQKVELDSDTRQALKDLFEDPHGQTLDSGDLSNIRVPHGIPEDYDIVDEAQSFVHVPTKHQRPAPIRFTPSTGKSSASLAEESRPTNSRLGRFHNMGLIGRGGMGEVYRVLDPDLNRRMVLKVLRPDRAQSRTAATRFLEEAQLTSQLHHPGIVPVHELGVLEDGRLYFTMREVRGRTLTEVIQECHGEF